MRAVPLGVEEWRLPVPDGLFALVRDPAPQVLETFDPDVVSSLNLDQKVFLVGGRAIRKGLGQAEQRRETVREERHQQRLYERQEQQRAAEQPQPPGRASAAVRVPERNWQAEQKWIERIVAGKLESFARGLAAEVVRIERDQLARLRQEVEDRIAKSDSATVELLLDLERRVAELERRAAPAKPRLVGGANAA